MTNPHVLIRPDLMGKYDRDNTNTAAATSPVWMTGWIPI